MKISKVMTGHDYNLVRSFEDLADDLVVLKRFFSGHLPINGYEHILTREIMHSKRELRYLGHHLAIATDDQFLMSNEMARPLKLLLDDYKHCTQIYNELWHQFVLLMLSKYKIDLSKEARAVVNEVSSVVKLGYLVL